jgi:molecular chaperone DnaK
VVGIHEPYLAGSGADAFHLELELERASLEEVAAPFIERTLSSVDEALAAAGLSGLEVDRVLLVGGSAQMPIVQARVAEHLDRPVLMAEHPDEAVARGASLLAGRSDGQDVDEVLVDVTPHTLSIGSVDSEQATHRLSAQPVIPRNTVVPVQRTQRAYTMVEDQPRVEAPVVQGEHAFADENVSLGLVEVASLPPSPARSPVDITYHLDVSGILHVTATHVPSGRSGEVTITRSPSRLSRQERRKAKEAVQALRAGPEDADADALDPGERRVAEALLARADRVLEKADDGTEDARATVAEARAALAAALEAGTSASEVADRSDALSEALLDLL